MKRTGDKLFVDLTNEEVDLMLKQIGALEKALYKVKQSRRILRAVGGSEIARNEVLIVSLRDKLLRSKAERMFPGEN